MTRTHRPSTPGSVGLTDDETSELARAAADLEALAEAYDACSRSLETLEAAVDTLLDDPSTSALLVDEELRVVGMSRGMAAVLGVERTALGSGVAHLVPGDWPDLTAVLGRLGHTDGWRMLPAGDEGARVQVRRAAEDDRAAVYVVRYLPPPA